MLLCSACKNAARYVLSSERVPRTTWTVAGVAPVVATTRCYRTEINETRRSSDDPLHSSRSTSPQSVTRIMRYEYTDKDRTIAKKELMHLTDPVKLNSRVRYYLGQNDFFKAIRLVRLAGPRIPNTVAWNGIISYLVLKGEFAHAGKAFNEMKKRGQIPDAFTYTHLLRGLARKPVSEKQLELAKHLYSTLAMENSKVKRDISIINAALTVSMTGNDSQWMWSIVSDFTTTGPCAPNAASFDIIFNGLRNMATDLPVSDPDRDGKIERAVSDARQIWSHVLDLRESGKLKTDRRLAIAYMSILLTESTAENAKEALSVAELALGLSNVAAHPSRHVHESNQEQRPRLSWPGSPDATDEDHDKVLYLVLLACRHLQRTSDGKTSYARTYWNLLKRSDRSSLSGKNIIHALEHCVMTGDSEMALEIVRLVSAQSDSHPKSAIPYDQIWTLGFRSCSKGMNDLLFSDRTTQDTITEIPAGREGSPPTYTALQSRSHPIPLPMQHAQAMFDLVAHKRLPKGGRGPAMPGAPGDVKPLEALRFYLSTSLSTQDASLILSTALALVPEVQVWQTYYDFQEQSHGADSPNESPSPRASGGNLKYEHEIQVFALSNLLKDITEVLNSKSISTLPDTDKNPDEVDGITNQLQSLQQRVSNWDDWLRRGQTHVERLLGPGSKGNDGPVQKRASRSTALKVRLLPKEYRQLDRWKGQLVSQARKSKPKTSKQPATVG